jgi:hypothetical protein
MRHRHAPPQAGSDNLPPNNDDKVRGFLLGWMILLTLIDIAIYFQTKDAKVLLASSLVGIPISYVFAHYFTRKNKERSTGAVFINREYRSC